MAGRKTSLYIDEELLREAKIYAAGNGSSLTRLVEQGLRRMLHGDESHPRGRRSRRSSALPTGLYRGDGRPNDADDIYA